MAGDPETPAEAAGPAVSRSFSTDRLPGRDRRDFFRGELAKLLTLDLEPLDGSPRHAMEILEAGPIAFSEVETSPARVIRHRDHLRDCDEGFVFFVMTAGWQQLAHNGREIRLVPGDAAMIQNCRPGIGDYPAGGSLIALRIAGDALRSVVRHPEHRAGALFERTRPGLALLKGYLRTFSQVKATLTPGLARSFGQHVIDLIALILGPTTDGAERAEAGGKRAARLARVLEAIAARACNPGFTVETVAAELGVSARYVQQILEESGATFSERVTEHRLIRARTLLGGAGRAKIADVALEAGFNDVAHFHRVFRRRFGATPGAMRGPARPA